MVYVVYVTCIVKVREEEDHLVTKYKEEGIENVKQFSRGMEKECKNR